MIGKINTTALAIIACLLWASSFLGVKIAADYTPPIQFAGLRFIIAGLILIPFNRNLKQSLRQIKKHWKYCTTLMLLQIVVGHIFFHIGIHHISSSLSSVLCGIAPLTIAIAAHIYFRDEKLNYHKILSIVLGFIGIVFVSFDKNQLQNTASFGTLLIGIICFIIVNINSSAVNIFLKKQRCDLSPITLCTATMLTGGFIMFFGAIPFEGFAGFYFPTEYYFSLGWLALLTASSFTIWLYVINKPETKISEVNLWRFLEPLVGAILSWICISNENPNMLSIIGITITILGLLYMNTHDKLESIELLNKAKHPIKATKHLYLLFIFPKKKK